MFTRARLAIGALTLVSVGACLASILERRDNLALRNELQAERAKPVFSPRQTAVETAAVENLAPPTAATSVQSLPSSAVEATLLNIIQNRLLRRDRPATLQVLASIDKRDLPRAIEIVERAARNGTRNALRAALLRRWTQVDPRAAAAWASALPPSVQNAELNATITDIWSETDPEAALAQRPLTFTALRNLTRKAPEKAAQLALAEGSPDQRAYRISSVAEAWFERDPEAAMKWAVSLPAVSEKCAALQPFINQLADVDPAVVGSYIATLPEDVSTSRLVRQLVSRWSEVDPSSAGQWIQNLPATKETRGEALRILARAWADDDPDAAMAWAATLPTEQDRTAATSSLIQTLASYEPTTAARLATSLTDPREKLSAIHRIAWSWFRQDPAAAKAWLATLSLSPESREELESYAETRPRAVCGTAFERRL